MIYVNGEKINFTKFPDGTASFRFDPNMSASFEANQDNSVEFEITWKYESDEECILLWYLVKHIRSIRGEGTQIYLNMPYIPNAKMDRVKNSDEVFTLKWFTEFINSLKFDRVLVFDPHSNVSAALIDRVYVQNPGDYIQSYVIPDLKQMGYTNILFCYPDEGAMGRYSSIVKGEYVYGVKRRDWRTGKIERLELADKEKVAGRNVLIIDDICSKGGTFVRTANALREAGAENIFLYVSHCENTIFKGSVLNASPIKHVFTTDSVFHDNSDKITLIPHN